MQDTPLNPLTPLLNALTPTMEVMEELDIADDRGEEDGGEGDSLAHPLVLPCMDVITIYGRVALDSPPWGEGESPSHQLPISYPNALSPYSLDLVTPYLPQQAVSPSPFPRTCGASSATPT